jgi:hypothetical protein
MTVYRHTTHTRCPSSPISKNLSLLRYIVCVLVLNDVVSYVRCSLGVHVDVSVIMLQCLNEHCVH